jgi:hypothetical protein
MKQILKNLSYKSEAWTVRRNDISRIALHVEDCWIHPLRTQKKQRNHEKIRHSINNRMYRKTQKKLERACWKDKCR